MFVNLSANHAEKNSAQELNLNAFSSHDKQDEHFLVPQQARIPEKSQ